MRTVWQVAVLALAVAAVAAPAAAHGDATTAPATDEAKANDSWAGSIRTLGACLGAALAVMGGSYGIARIGGACIEAMARQPEAARDMFAPMVVTAGMVEVGMLFTILVCWLIS